VPDLDRLKRRCNLFHEFNETKGVGAADHPFSVLGRFLFFRLLATAGTTNVLLVTFLIPISALLLGVGILGEIIKVLEYAGMG